MLIIPFIHKITNEKDMNIHNIRILTIGGKYLWEEQAKEQAKSKAIIKEIHSILKTNDIYSNNIRYNPEYNMYLCEVDINKTDINDIYKWSEIDIDTDTFCWRDYIHFIGKNNDYWLYPPKNEKLGDISIRYILEKVI